MKKSIPSSSEQDTQTVWEQIVKAHGKTASLDTNASEIILNYRVQDDSIHHLTTQVTAIYGIPQIIEHGPEYLVRSGIILPEYARVFLDTFRSIRSGAPRAECTIRVRTAKGEFLWLNLTLSTIFNKEGNAVHAVGILKDITQYREMEQRTADQYQQMEMLMKNAQVYYEIDLTNKKFLYRFDGSNILQFEQTDSYEQALEQLITHVVFPQEAASLRNILNPDALMKRYESGEKKVDVDYRRLNKNGTIHWVHGTGYLIKHPQTNVIKMYFYVNNLADHKPENKLYKNGVQQHTVTGMYQQTQAYEQIKDAIAAGEPEGWKSAFVLIDLDNFKNLNQQYGSFFGDEALSSLGKRIQSLCDNEDVVGYLSGNIFILYLRHLQNLEAVENTVDYLCNQLIEARPPEVRKCNVTATIGVSIYPDHGKTFEELFKHTQTALNYGKKNGKNGWFIYQPALDEGYIPPAFLDIAPLTEQQDTHNLAEHIFHMLYHTDDIKQTLHRVVQEVAEHFGFERGYIYEATPNGGGECLLQWSSPQLQGEYPHRQILDETQFSAYQQLFSADGIYLGKRNPVDLHSKQKITFEETPFQILCAFWGNDKYHGLMGFDCRGKIVSQLSSADRKLLAQIAQIVDIFLYEHLSGQALEETGFLLQAITEGLNACAYIIDPETYLLKLTNQNTLQIIREAKTGTYCYETIRGRLSPCEDCPFVYMKKKGTVSCQTEMYLDRYELWAQVSTSLMTLPNGKTYGVFRCFDFSNHKSTKTDDSIHPNAFTYDTSLYDALALSTDDYIYMCDMTKNLFYFPQTMVEEFSLPAQSVENAIPLWASLIHEEDQETFLENNRQIMSGETNTFSQEYRMRNKDGVWVWLQCKGHMERDKHGNPTLYAGVITNIKGKNKIDHLTGLPDKYEFEIRTTMQMEEGVTKGGLLLLGLDNFKYINNIYGWEFGDQVLRESTKRMIAALPEDACLHRLDGDKFGVFLPDSTMEDIEKYYSDLARTFHHQRQTGSNKYRCTISGGCALLDFDKEFSFSTLYMQAGFALDFSKREGKNRLTIYDDNTMSDNERMLSLISHLHENVEQGCKDFEVYYQPQINPTTFEVVSAEALLRWHCPGIGTVSPVEFIPLLEQSGLIHQVGRWVLEEAAQVCHQWRQLAPNFTVSVNLSYVQLQDQSFLSYLTQKVESGEIYPEEIHLEITESCIADGSRMLVGNFRVLREMNFHIEMDDFGTGYSSLEILKNAPADVVKIDRAFVRDITTSNFDATFIQFVVALCHSVGISVCLEGVETWQEYDLVKPMSLDLIQGFLFGRPVPQKEFEEQYLCKTLILEEATI